MSTKDSPSARPPVIVRAFNDEPVALVAHRLDLQASVVFVGADTALRPIGMPIADVYDYDESSFGSLRKAYSSDNRDVLLKLYESLGRKIGACNRYQDVLNSQHEKEPEIANTTMFQQVPSPETK